jgi:hypothetical protein
MLYLTTARKERLEIPPACVTAVMRPSGGTAPGALVFDLGFGPQVEQLDNDYGWVKRIIIDCGVMANPVELRILEPAAEGNGLAEGLMFVSRQRIVGRREVLDDPAGVRARLFVDLIGKTTPVSIADTLDDLDGIAAPAPLTATQPEES